MVNQLVNTRGKIVLAEIDQRLADLLTAEINFAKAQVRIGMLINEVRANKYWEGEYESFDGYLKSVEAKFNRKRTQLYVYASLCRDLLPEVGEDKLAEMGLEKAKLLGMVKRATGHLPSPEIIEMATDDKISRDDFRKTLLAERKIPDSPAVKFFSIEYAAEPEQQKTITEAFLSVKRTENLTGGEELQMGVVLECLGAEYLGAHSEVL